MQYNVNKQHDNFKLHAIERLRLLLDKDSFKEIGKDVSEFGTAYSDSKYQYDGVITGYGYIKNKLVFVYAQDFTVCGGTVGLKHAKKIVRVIDLAIENKVPIIGINDSGGARIQEGVNSLAGYGEIFFKNSKASGYIPQISIIVGPCAGGAVYSPGITDFVFMTCNTATMYVTGPRVLKQMTGVKCSQNELGGADVHSKSGVVHFIHNNEKDCFNAVQKLISLLPQNCEEKNKIPPNYIFKKVNLSENIPTNSRKIYDMHILIDEVVDDNDFFEVHKKFATNIIVGFGKISGILIGIVANNPNSFVGVLDCDASVKAARFIRFCDCYNIPIITFVDVPGFMPSIQEEEKGIIRHGAKLLFAYSEATTIKVTIIIRKAYGGAYIAMGSKHLGADLVFCWPIGEVAVMGAEGAVEILYRKELEKVDIYQKDEYIKRYCQKYEKRFVGVSAALKEGYIDGIIEPNQTREVVFNTLVALQNKNQQQTILKKHNNIPL